MAVTHIALQVLAFVGFAAAVAGEILSTVLNNRKAVRGPGPSGLACLPSVVFVAGLIALRASSDAKLAIGAGWAVFYLLVARGIPIVWARANDYGRSALHRAVLAHDETGARVAIASGVDIEAKAFGGWTALHWAVANSDEAMVRLLLSLGADPNARTGDQVTPLSYAAGRGLLGIARALLDAGADANVPDMGGRTALDAAGDPAMKELLLEHGARERSG